MPRPSSIGSVSSSHDIVSNLLESVGDVVAERLPAEAMIALTEIASLVAPSPPAVLIVSADPYVPWELARMPVPIDPSRPISALRFSSADGCRTDAPAWTRRPSAATRAAASTLSVKCIAVMAGQYRAESRLEALPSAEQA